MTKPIFGRDKKLMFGQVREDAEVDLYLLGKLREPNRAFVIASGGCTAFSMLTVSGLQVDAIDVSEAQIALVEAKKSMFKTLGLDVTRDACKSDATAAYREIRKLLSDDARTILDANSQSIQRGLNNAGWVDMRMQQIASLFYAFVHDRATTETLLSMCDVSQQLEFYREKWCNWQWKLGLNVAFSRVFMTIMHGPDAERLIPPDFSTVMQRRLVRALTEVSACTNPYLWQTFFGRYNDRDDALPAYLQTHRWDAISRNLDHLSIHCCGTVDWLRKQPDHSIDYFGLSNILELLPDDYAKDVQREVLRCARADALVCVRAIFPRKTEVFDAVSQNGFRLDLESQLKSEAEGMDRSLFCNFYQIYRCVSV
jgi:S-adenosylmethionine:diacylglycerol 3-amino-3-carboxypropyl transferase